MRVSVTEYDSPFAKVAVCSATSQPTTWFDPAPRASVTVPVSVTATEAKVMDPRVTAAVKVGVKVRFAFNVVVIVIVLRVVSVLTVVCVPCAVNV